MKSLYESILDNEEDILSAKTTVMLEWCDKHLSYDWIGDAHTAYKIENKKITPDLANLYVDGEIPNFIKWNGNKDGVVNIQGKIKSYKNFPHELKSLSIHINTIPNDFTSMPELNIKNYLTLDAPVSSIKGLKGHIGTLKINISNMNEFKADNNLIVDTLVLSIDNYGNTTLKNIEKLPNIKKEVVVVLNFHNFFNIYEKVYTNFKLLINQNETLKKIFKGKLTKAAWKKSGEIHAEI